MAEIKYLDKTGLSTVWSKVKGIVTPKADKVSGATAGHLAGLNSSGNLMDSGLPASNIAQKDGSYSGMTVGAAEDLVSAESVASEFTSRITGGSTAVGKGGTALVDKIKGRTLVWNQLVQNGNFSNGTTGWSQYNSTISDSNGELTIEKSSGSASTGGFARTSITGDPTHKYYMACDAEMLTSGVELYLGFHTTGGTVGENAMASTVSSSYTRISQIASPISKTDTFSVRVGAAASPANSTGKIKNVILIDLTLMFGDNEPSTPEEFEALYPDPYYDYNPGTPKSNAATAIETEGWNIFTTENIATGYAVLASNGTLISSSTVSTTDYLPVLPEKDYFFNVAFTIGSGAYGVCFYDGNKNYISGQTSPTGYSLLRTTPAGARYMRATVRNTSIPAACIALSDPSRNGTYEPHWRSRLELGLGDIKVKSHNIWDEEWEAGNVSSTTGENASSTTLIRSVNYIKVEPGETYYAGTTGDFYYRFYDNNKNYIPFSSSFVQDANRARTVFTMPEGVGYIRFIHTGTTYANDICLSISDPAFNGRYEPYGNGGVISITGGLKSAGEVYDEISGGKFIKRIDSMDLGELPFELAYGDTYHIFRVNSMGSYVPGFPTAKQGGYPGICPKFINASWGTIAAYATSGIDDAFCLSDSSIGTNALCIRDTSYNDAATFKAAMAGVPLYYELAQPIEYELADALPTAMRNDPYGTERRLPEDTAAIVTAPFRADITYSTNIKEAVQSLPQNYININSMQDFLAALGTLMGGTWTMRPADGKFDFTFTPNPSNE